jgi:hypothetical protein
MQCRMTEFHRSPGFRLFCFWVLLALSYVLPDAQEEDGSDQQRASHARQTMPI